MSGSTTNLDLQYLDPSQAEPEVKVNDAWNKIDAAVGLAAGVEVSQSGDSPSGNVKAVKRIKFVGATVTEETDSVAVVTIESGGGSDGDGGSSEGGSSPVDVTDGTTTVDNITAIHFTSGATVTASGSVAEVAIAGGDGGGTATFLNGNVTPDSHPASPTARDDEFEGTTLDPKWTERSTVGTVGYSIESGSLVMTGASGSVNTNNTITQPIAVTGSPWRFRTKQRLISLLDSTFTGIWIGIASTGDGYYFGRYTGETAYMLVNNQSAYVGVSPTSTTAVFGSSATSGYLAPELYLDVRFDGTDFIFSVSADGVVFADVITLAASGFVADSVGLFGGTIAASSALTGSVSYDWFRDYTDGYTAAVGTGGATVDVTDGTTTVDNITAIRFISGATVTAASGSVAEVTIAGGGGGAATFLNANVTVDSHPASPTASDDEFEGATLDPKWSWLNQNTASAVVANGWLQLTSSTQAGAEINAIAQPVPTGSAWEIRMRVSQLVQGPYNNSGFVLFESTTGKALRFILFDAGSGVVNYDVSEFSSLTAAGSSLGNGAVAVPPVYLEVIDWLYFSLQLSAGNYIWSVSLTGEEGTFQPLISSAVGAYFTTAADTIGIAASGQNASFPATVYVDWFRDYTDGYAAADGIAEPVNVTPDTHPASPNPADDEFEGATLDTGGTRRSGATAWALVNFSTATAALQMGCLDLVTDINATSGRAPRLVVQALPGGAAWRYRAKLSVLIGTANVGGMVAYESASGKLLAMGFFSSTPDLAMLPYPSLTTDPSPYNSVSLAGIQDAITLETDWRYVEFELASGNLICRYSRSGLNGTFATFTTNAVATYFTTAPDHIGFYGETVSATIASRTRADWFRRMA
jgi:hypothetical protein